MFVFAFFLLARKSNLVPTTTEDLLLKRFLLREDVSIDNNKLLVSMKWTKTIQFGQRVLVTPFVVVMNSPLRNDLFIKEITRLIQHRFPSKS